MTRDARVVTTRDFTLAAVLLVNGFALLDTEPDSPDSPRRRRFVLRGDPETFAKLNRSLLLDDVLVRARAVRSACSCVGGFAPTCAPPAGTRFACAGGILPARSVARFGPSKEVL